MPRLFVVVALIAGGTACADARHAGRPDEAPARPAAAPPAAVTGERPAPVDSEIASLPNARGTFMGDDAFGAIYVVTVGSASVTPAAPAEPPLVLVHGLGTNGMRDFYPVLAPLAAHRRVVMFDLPGFGRSG